MTTTLPQAAASAPVPAAEALTSQLRTLRDTLLGGLVERDVEVRLALLAALAGEHLLLLGPPGTAKSLVARRLRMAFADATYFERLLTRFTVPEELFGPLSIKGLEEDRYERLVESYLPTASIAFLDEIFKANSAILNALLTLLNEREFDNGAKRLKTPLVAVIGASNELPEGDELGALFDRFLLRLHVGPVSKEAFAQLLGLRGNDAPEVANAMRLSPEILDAAREQAEKVTVPDDVVALLHELREFCAAQGMPVSDRRWRKIVKLLQVSAWSNGRAQVSIWDGWLLQHVVWSQPEERQKVYVWYTERVGTSAAMTPTRLTRLVSGWEGSLAADVASRSQRRDDEGKPLYKGPDGKPTPEGRSKVQDRRGGDPLFLAPVKCWTNQHRRDSYLVKDRTNGGKGYTLAELGPLYVGDYENFPEWDQRATYLAARENWLLVDIDLPPLMEPTRHKGVYLDDCVQRLGELRHEVVNYQAQLAAHLRSMQHDISSHLWVTDDFVEPASRALKRTHKEVDALLERLEGLVKGFRALPRHETPDHAAASKPRSKQRGATS